MKIEDQRRNLASAVVCGALTAIILFAGLAAILCYPSKITNDLLNVVIGGRAFMPQGVFCLMSETAENLGIVYFDGEEILGLDKLIYAHHVKEAPESARSLVGILYHEDDFQALQLKNRGMGPRYKVYVSKDRNGKVTGIEIYRVFGLGDSRLLIPCLVIILTGVLTGFLIWRKSSTKNAVNYRTCYVR